MGYFSVCFLLLLGRLPLSFGRAVGYFLGRVLYVFVSSRRHVVHTNLALCFPQLDSKERRKIARQTFVYFAQSWIDRGWLWQAPEAVLKRRINVRGDLAIFEGKAPLLLFCPHFYGLDAAAVGIAMRVLHRRFTSIYTPQASPAVDAWIHKGRSRIGDVRIFSRSDGVKSIVTALRAGEPLYLLPDMNFGEEESIFVPFYGVPAATVPSLARFARLGRAKVVPVIVKMVPNGYEVDILPAWENFPTDDVVADTALMNARLEKYIDAMPAQYFWVHKRFKTRPPGEPSVYH